MGNKTRKQHNTGSKQTSATQQSTLRRADIELSFPFYVVDRVTMIFGANIPGYTEVINAVPQEFHNSRNPWCELAEHIFFRGADASNWKFRSPHLKTLQMAYLRTWLGSFDPPHEVKERVCGWLLSLMLTECPKVR